MDDDIDWLYYFDVDDTCIFGDIVTSEHDYNPCNQSLELPYTNQVDENDHVVLSLDQFPYFDPTDEYLCSPEWWEVDQGLPNSNDDHNVGQSCYVTSSSEAKIATAATTTTTVGGGGHRNRPRALELEEIEKCYEMPIAMAAKELSVGLTVLKKRCRELNIRRWPYRKLKSLKSLIQNVKELGLNEEIEMLEEQKRMMEKLPEMPYTQRTKKLRQACFKATYKKRRS